jgi:hypothetical protein
MASTSALPSDEAHLRSDAKIEKAKFRPQLMTPGHNWPIMMPACTKMPKKKVA